MHHRAGESPRSLDQVLRRVLSLALGGAVLTAGCSSDSDAGEPQSICPPGVQRSLWDAARETAGVDFLGLRYAEPTPAFGNHAGDLCSGATDKAACTSLAMTIPGDGGFPGYGVIIATRGQEVIVLDTVSKAASMLHPEVPEVAALFALGFSTGGPEVPNALCGSVKYRRDGDSVVISTEFRNVCSGGAERLSRSESRVERDGQVKRLSSETVDPPGGCPIVGRLHEGEPSFSSFDLDERGLLLRAAYYERGSVDSFERLARELDAHGAPRSLVDRARTAADEERTHARVTSDLARTRGVTELAFPPPAPSYVRDLEAIALENAVEGCVREAYAAIVTLHQSMRAEATDVREAMTAIAVDEIGHAALAWDVATWAEAKLDEDARGRVDAARREAFDELVDHACATSPDASTRLALGLPDDGTAARIARELMRALS